jgi:hypothetical protein
MTSVTCDLEEIWAYELKLYLFVLLLFLEKLPAMEASGGKMYHVT